MHEILNYYLGIRMKQEEKDPNFSQRLKLSVSFS